MLEVIYIENTVCRIFGVDREMLYYKSRKREIVDARRVVFYFIRETLYYSYEKIANIYDMKHCNILFHCNRLIELMESDRILRHRFNEVKERILTDPFMVIQRVDLLTLSENHTKTIFEC